MPLVHFLTFAVVNNKFHDRSDTPRNRVKIVIKVIAIRGKCSGDKYIRKLALDNTLKKEDCIATDALAKRRIR